MNSPAALRQALDAPSVVLEGAPPPGLWLSDPIKAHAQWRASLALADRSYAQHTTAMYESLFGRFCRWMIARKLKLNTVNAAEVARFLGEVRGRAGRDPTIRTRRMYLAEIDRVMAYLVSLEMRLERPTLELIDRLRGKEPLQPRTIVLPGDNFAAALREHLLSFGLATKARPHHLRDAACAALMLDCGLTVKELQKLRVSHFRAGEGASPARLHAPGHRLLKERDLELSEWAAALLQRWIARRLHGLAHGKDPGRVKVFAHAAKKGALKATTVHRFTVAACKPCGVAAGPQMLRNEFVANLVRSDCAPHEAAYRAGLHDVDQIYAMRRALGMLDKAANEPAAAIAA